MQKRAVESGKNAHVTRRRVAANQGLDRTQGQVRKPVPVHVPETGDGPAELISHAAGSGDLLPEGGGCRKEAGQEEEDRKTSEFFSHGGSPTFYSSFLGPVGNQKVPFRHVTCHAKGHNSSRVPLLPEDPNPPE